jgi:hypothetical protein
MRRWLLQSRYTVEGLKDIRASGGTEQRDRLSAVVEALGGRCGVLFHPRQPLSRGHDCWNAKRCHWVGPAIS